MSLRQELAALGTFVILFVVGLTVMNRLLLPRGVSKPAVLIVTSIIVALLTVFVRYQLFYRRKFLH